MFIAYCSKLILGFLSHTVATSQEHLINDRHATAVWRTVRLPELVLEILIAQRKKFN